MNKFLIAAFVIAILVAASLILFQQKSAKTIEKEDIAFETISKGTHSGYTSQAEIVINQEFVFSDLWQKVHSIYSKIPSEPQIDFSKETVIAVFMGQKNTGGYLIEIEKIVDKNNNVVVYTKETMPKPREIVTQELTQPYHIVKIKKIAKPIQFEKVGP